MTAVATSGCARAGLISTPTFLEAEWSRWAAAVAAGRLYFAVSAHEPIGFAALGFVDGEPFLRRHTPGGHCMLSQSNEEWAM